MCVYIEFCACGPWNRNTCAVSSYNGTVDTCGHVKHMRLVSLNFCPLGPCVPYIHPLGYCTHLGTLSPHSSNEHNLRNMGTFPKYRNVRCAREREAVVVREGTAATEGCACVPGASHSHTSSCEHMRSPRTLGNTRY